MLVASAASKAIEKSNTDKKRATRVSDVSSVEPNESEPEEESEPEGTEAAFESVRCTITLLHEWWLILLLIAPFDANRAPTIECQ